VISGCVVIRVDVLAELITARGWRLWHSWPAGLQDFVVATRWATRAYGRVVSAGRVPSVAAPSSVLAGQLDNSAGCGDLMVRSHH
jgi:hypothetical protein